MASRPPPDYLSLAVETLADSELELFERVADLEADLAAVRVALHEACTALYIAIGERDGLRRENRRLRDQLRVLVGAERAVAEARQRRRAA
jgi:regulator of replication initiation timing